NGNQYSMPSLTSQDKGNLSFYKNASVTVEDGRLKFTPFYVLNGDAVDPAYMNLSSFDINDENSWGTFFGGICDTHYLNTDFYNLAYGKYSDGVNTYSAISNESQLKNIINSTYYTANCSSPYDYFSDYLGYGEDEDVYLLLNQPTQFYSKPEKTRYTLFDALNISDSKSYPTTWSSETFQQNTIPNGSKFALILTPTENVSKSKIDTNLVGEGEITVSGLENGNAISGETIDVKITAPENCWITSITAYYHNDKNDTTKKVLSDGLTTNEFTLNYPVPYSNVTIEVVTKEIPTALNTDANGNFIVSSPDDLYQMAAMVNSGYESYVYGNYVLTKNITLEGENNWSTPIGTTDSPFKGTFDGQRNVIYNLSLDSNNEDANFGLFGTIIGGEVHNLYVDIETYSVLFCHDSVGPICGNVKNGKILNCIAIGNFAGGAKAVGGIAGTAENSIIKNCNSELLIFSDKHSYTDGICGVNNNSQIIDCKSNSQIYS
ncbi:MAG: hypothetical protein IKB73_02740, partial [Ruminococcus sp.]|nr:hypothetical protein [Ruminococcus sp.]